MEPDDETTAQQRWIGRYGNRIGLTLMGGGTALLVLTFFSGGRRFRESGCDTHPAVDDV